MEKIFLAGATVALFAVPSLALAATPVGWLDVIDTNGSAGGWALDQDTPTQSITVHFYLDGPAGQGIDLGQIVTNGSRPDVNTAMNVTGNHGFSWQIPNTYAGSTHQLYVYAVDSSGNGDNPNLLGSPKTFTMTVPNKQPIGNLEVFTSTGVAAWACDSDDYTQPLTIDIYKDGPKGSGGVFVGHYTANTSRQDLVTAGVCGGNPNHGLAIPLPSAFKDGISHTLYAYAVNIPAGNDFLLWSSPLTFAYQLTMSGAFDGPGPVATGWALQDSDQTQTVTVKLYLNKAYDQGGTLLGSALANVQRADLNTAGYSGNHGFSFAIPDQYLDGGTHALYAYAVRPDGTLFSLWSSPANVVLQCSLSRCPVPIALAVSSNDGHVKVEAVGNTEIVFKHDTDACAEDDIPDTPVRAFRSADGNVHLMSTHYPANYGSVGTTFDTLQHRCISTLASAGVADFNTLTYHEWLDGFYTLDGTTVYAVTHNEWYGEVAEPMRCTYGHSWVNSITLALSNDGGATFHHPADYKIRVPQVPWSSQFGCTVILPDGHWETMYGSFFPTNIIKGTDNYYYTFLDVIQPKANGNPNLDGSISGVCLMRTNDLSHASSWQILTGSGWANAQTNPACRPLFPEGMTINSVQYSTYLHSYIAFGVWDNVIDYWLSPDLTSWSPSSAVKIMTLTPYNGRFVYPTLLDPSDTSRDFESVGREPYIYFTIFKGGLNRDLMRQKIRFTNLDPSCTPTWSCTVWSQCSTSGSQSRTCTDTNACGTTAGRPAESQSCTPAAASCTFNGQTVAHSASVTAYQTSSVAYGQTCASEQRTCANGTLSGSYTNASCSVGTASSCTFNGQSISNGSSVTAYQSSSVAYGQTCTQETRVCTNGILSGSYTNASCSVNTPTAQFSLSDRVQATGNVNARSTPSTSGNVAGVQSIAALGSIVDGPTTANGYLWWKVSWDTGLLGWNVQDYLQKASVGAGSCTQGGLTVQSGSSQTFYSSRAVSFGTTCASVSQTRACANGVLAGSNVYQYSSCGVSAAQSCTFNGQSVANGSSVTAYQSSSVAYGSQCVSETRACANGTLSGTYQYASCSVAPAPAPNSNSSSSDHGASNVTTFMGTIPPSTTSSGGTAALPAPVATSASDQSQQIAALLAQIKQLQALLAQLIAQKAATLAASPSTSVQPTAQTAAAPTLTPSTGSTGSPQRSSGQVRDLSLGSRGTDVETLQTFLITLKLLPSDSATGYFGRATEVAVQSYQSATGIVSSGTPATTGYGAVGPKTRATMAASSAGATTGAGSGVASTATGGTAPVVNTPNVSTSNIPSVPAPTLITPPATTSSPASCMFNGQMVASAASVTAYAQASVAYGQQCSSETRACSNGTLSGSNQYASCSVGTASACTFNGQTVASGQSVSAYQSSSVPTGSQCVSESRTCANGVLSGTYQNTSCITAAAAEIQRWIMPNYHFSFNHPMATEAWGNYFSNESQLKNTLTHTDVYSSWLDEVGQNEGHFLNNLMPILKKYNILFNVDGSVTTCRPNSNELVSGTEWANYALSLVKPVYDAGGRVDYYSIDLFPLGVITGGCATAEQAYPELVRFMKRFHEVHPETKFGIVTNFPNYGYGNNTSYWQTNDSAGDFQAHLENILAAVANAGEKLYFVDVDNPYDYATGVHPHTAGYSQSIDWMQRILNLEAQVKRHGLRFGVMYNSEIPGQGTDGHGGDDQQYFNDTLAYIQAYKERSGSPDDVIIVSWYPHPSGLFPDYQPYTFTYLVDKVFDITGSLESASPDGVIAGWAVSPYISTPITVHIYVDGPYGSGGTLAGVATANLTRSDVNRVTGYPGDHGFSFTLPLSVSDGTHTIYVYGIDPKGINNLLIAGSPRTVTLARSMVTPSNRSNLANALTALESALQALSKLLTR